MLKISNLPNKSGLRIAHFPVLGPFFGTPGRLATLLPGLMVQPRQAETGWRIRGNRLQAIEKEGIQARIIYFKLA
jgi:hypothetical protein